MLYSTLVNLLLVVLTNSCYLSTLLGNVFVSPKHLKLNILCLCCVYWDFNFQGWWISESSRTSLFYSVLVFSYSYLFYSTLHCSILLYSVLFDLICAKNRMVVSSRTGTTVMEELHQGSTKSDVTCVNGWLLSECDGTHCLPNPLIFSQRWIRTDIALFSELINSTRG